MGSPGRFRTIRALAIIVAISVAIVCLFESYDRFNETALGLAIAYFFLPGMMFSAFLVCGVHGGSLPDFLCVFVGVFVQLLVIWLIARAIWRLFARPRFS